MKPTKQNILILSISVIFFSYACSSNKTVTQSATVESEKTTHTKSETNKDTKDSNDNAQQNISTKQESAKNSTQQVKSSSKSSVVNTLNINGLEVDLDSLSMRDVTILKYSIGKDGYNKYDKDAKYNTEVKIAASENLEYFGLSTYNTPNPYTDLYIGNSVFEAFAKNGKSLFKIEKESFSLDNAIISEDGNAYYIFWTNLAINDARLCIYDRLGNEILSESNIEYISNVTTLKGNKIYYLRNKGNGDNLICSYDVITKSKWEQEFHDYAGISSFSKETDAIIIISYSKLFLYVANNLIWEKPRPAKLELTNISYDAKYILFSYADDRIILSDANTKKEILNLCSVYPKKNQAYAKFIEETYNIAICEYDYDLHKTKISIYNITGTKLLERFYSLRFPITDFFIKNSNNNYQLYIGKKYIDSLPI